MKTAVLASSIFLLLASSGFTAQKNLFDIHNNAGKLSNKECLSCHADIKKDVTGDKKIKTFHRHHLESKLDTPKKCSDCHTVVDLRQGSGGAMRKQVNPEVCADCHTGGMDGAKVLYAR